MSTPDGYIRPTSIEPYQRLIRELTKCSDTEKIQIARRLCRIDLFFLLWFGCNRVDAARQWVIDRCREIEAAPDGYLDLWAREHYKSTIITFGLTIQDILRTHGEGAEGEEVTVGIFSHSRPIAKGFLRQIKHELERNDLLKWLFPDILYEDPQRDSPKWSEDEGIIVRRKGNPKESTVEAWGLVDGMPTGRHFRLLMYDDVVTEKSVTTPSMIRKTTTAVELSFNLGADGGERRWAGTRYHFNDTYGTLIQRGSVNVRKYPATTDGKPEGEPVMMSREQLANKRRDMGAYTFGCQMLLDPKAGEKHGFPDGGIQYYQERPNDNRGNRYILVDPANEKKASSDYTAAWVVELREDENYYVLDMVRDRLSLTERADLLFRWHRNYKQKGRDLPVGYEKYGMQADIEHIEDRQQRENYRFKITPLGGPLTKNDRIRQLIPLYEANRWFFPQTMHKTDYQGRTEDLVQTFINEEYLPFPVANHDDMLDSQARILDPDLGAVFPTPTEEVEFLSGMGGTFG